MSYTHPPNTPTTVLKPSRRIVVMGVSGCGKSTLGEALGKRLGVAYIDGDEYHPQPNIDKMARGSPLDDDDREGWLAALAALIDDSRKQDRSLLVGCSALKHKYRAQLRAGDPALGFLFLDGSYDLILERMQARAHFFSPDMLQTQFDTLETPAAHEAIRISIDPAFERVVDACVYAVLATAQRE